MARSRSRLAADWFAKLRQNETTGEVEHTDVADVEATVDTSLSSEVSTLNSSLSTLEAYVNTSLANVGGASAPTYQLFTTSGTWTKPEGCTRVHVTCIGSGGGGARGRNAYASQNGGGGGGGAFAQGWVDVSGVTSVAISAGAGGAGIKGESTATSQAGVAGSFGSFVTATGGGEAYNRTSNGGRGGYGGVASGGYLNINGTDGKAYTQGQTGGWSWWGFAGGMGLNADATYNGFDGFNAEGYGAGGRGSSSGGPDAGDGAPGFVLVEEYYE